MWSTTAGTFKTIIMTTLNLKLPKPNYMTEITVKCHFKEQFLNYDLIQGRDFPHELGIALPSNELFFSEEYNK